MTDKLSKGEAVEQYEELTKLLDQTCELGYRSNAMSADEAGLFIIANAAISMAWEKFRARYKLTKPPGRKK